MPILVLAEHDHQSLNPLTKNVLNAAKQFEQPISVLVAGADCHAVADQVAKLNSVETVLLADDAVYAHHLPEALAQLIANLIDDYQIVLAPASTFGKNLLPRVAGLLDVDQLSDVTEIIDLNTFIRPIYAGNALEKVRFEGDIKILTVRASAFVNPLETQDNPAKIELLTDSVANNLSRFVKIELSQSERPDLSTADIVISGGRGLQNKDNFRLIESLADKLGAAIGASRAAVDAGFISNDFQVGQTGKIVAPKLYIAIGISGAIQHVAGMRNSKVIVAINKDSDAPIFEIADFGLVGDLFTLIPELEAALEGQAIS